MSSTEKNQGGALKKELGFFDVTSVALGLIIGSGIYIMPAIIAKMMGPAQIVAWIIGGFICILVGLCYAELGSMYKESGGAFVYVTEAFGKFTGFMMGWVFVIAYWAILAAEANAFAIYLSYLWPAAETTMKPLIVILLLLFFTYINYRGIKTSSVVQNLFSIAKTLPLLILGFTGILFIKLENFRPFAPLGWATLGGAVLTTFWPYFGFEEAAVPAEEVKNPKRNIPLGMIAGILLGMFVYLLIVVVVTGILPQQQLSATDKPLADAATGIFGPAGAILIVIAALVSIAGATNGSILCYPRLCYSMSRHHLLPKIFAKIHPIFKTPYYSIAFVFIMSSVFGVSGSFETLALVATTAFIFQYLMASLSLIVLRHKQPNVKRIFRVPILIPVFSVLACAWMLVNAKSEEIIIFSALLVSGAVYYLLRPKAWKKED
jgi:amino acid transporter